MKLAHLGYNDNIETARIEANLTNFDIGRVIMEHKERYRVATEKGTLDAEIIGNLRYTANSRMDFPAVGDWVALTIYDTHNAIIHKVLPRTSVLSRKSVSESTATQIIATNIDVAFIVQAVDRDFSISRIERYLTICNSSNIEPVIILSKIDLVNKIELKKHIDDIKKRISNIPIFPISNTTKQGIESLQKSMEKGKTYCLLGSSGIGKSTLVNILAGKEAMKTKMISTHSKRGTHTTTHRELILLENGEILIDNPGMREVGIAAIGDGLEKSFEIIAKLAKQCKFNDCSHTHEVGCAVIKALENGDIDTASYQNYLKIRRERDHYKTSVAEKRKKDKAFGKMVKRFKNIKNNT